MQKKNLHLLRLVEFSRSIFTIVKTKYNFFYRFLLLLLVYWVCNRVYNFTMEDLHFTPIVEPITSKLIRWVCLGSQLFLPTFISGDIREYGNTFYYLNEPKLFVFLGCSGFQNMFQITCIILTASGSIFRKLLYLPFALFIIYIASVVHIIILVYAVIYQPTHYAFFHNYITKIIFYIFFFMIWLIWEEKLSRAYHSKNYLKS